MENLKFTYWQDGKFWLGYLNEYPEYTTQGETFDDLIDHLKDIFKEIKSEQLPGKRNQVELVI